MPSDPQSLDSVRMPDVLSEILSSEYFNRQIYVMDEIDMMQELCRRYDVDEIGESLRQVTVPAMPGSVDRSGVNALPLGWIASRRTWDKIKNYI